MMKGSTIIIILFIILNGCSDDPTPSANFVVEAFITANEPINNIKIKGTSPIDSINVTDEPIPTAIVGISDGTNQNELTFNAATGLYEDLNELISVSNSQSYTLSVTVGEREAFAETVVPVPPTGLQLPDSILAVPQLALSFGLREQITNLFSSERITLRWDSVPGQSFFVVIENRVDELDPILPEGVPAEAQELLSSFRFISEPSETPEFEIIGVALDTYGPHIAKVFTVNQEYIDLFDNVEQDSRDLNEPPSNVDNAQGIFTAFAVDSVSFNVIRR